jgi:hypothetical protein
MKYENEELAARRQAAGIRRFWGAEGYAVEVWVERVEGVNRNGDRNAAGYWAIRTDLVNGHPTKRIDTCNSGSSGSTSATAPAPSSCSAPRSGLRGPWRK